MRGTFSDSEIIWLNYLVQKPFARVNAKCGMHLKSHQ